MEVANIQLSLLSNEKLIPSFVQIIATTYAALINYYHSAIIISSVFYGYKASKPSSLTLITPPINSVNTSS